MQLLLFSPRKQQWHSPVTPDAQQTTDFSCSSRVNFVATTFVLLTHERIRAHTSALHTAKHLQKHTCKCIWLYENHLFTIYGNLLVGMTNYHFQNLNLCNFEYAQIDYFVLQYGHLCVALINIYADRSIDYEKYRLLWNIRW